MGYMFASTVETCQWSYMTEESTGELPEDRDGFRFRGGSIALDLAATLQARRSAAPRELLRTPADLDRWLISSGLASTRPRATRADLKTAHTLREAIFMLAARVAETSFDPAACMVLNQIAGRRAAWPTLSEDGQVELRGDADALLATLAQDAVRLFGTEAHRIRRCESETCSIYFVDTSRSARRRWCSMSACGNKAKVSALRSRKRNLLADN